MRRRGWCEAHAGAVKDHPCRGVVLVASHRHTHERHTGGKRADMGAVAGRLADRVIVTNDNPRTEDPRRIADDIAEGLRASGARYDIELDRANAIERALDAAHAGDIIVLAGKGHEDYQEANGERLPFSDARHVADALARLLAVSHVCVPPPDGQSG